MGTNRSIREDGELPFKYTVPIFCYPSSKLDTSGEKNPSIQGSDSKKRPSPTRSPPKKQRISDPMHLSKIPCKHFFYGPNSCRNGSNCRFSHDTRDRQSSNFRSNSFSGEYGPSRVLKS